MRQPSFRRLAACTVGLTLTGLTAAPALALSCDKANYILPAPNPVVQHISKLLTNNNPNGCQDGFALQIDASGHLINQAGFTLLPGLLGVNGRGGLSSYGALTNAASGTLDSYADIHNNINAVLTNEGVFTNNALLVNAGYVVNNGKLFNKGMLSMTGIGGSFENHGQLDNAAGATLELTSLFQVIDWAGGTVNNAGTLRVSYLDIGDASGQSSPYSSFNLMAGSRLETGDLVIRQGATQGNAGTLRNTGDMGVYGTLVNDGDIQTGSLTLDYAGFGLAILNNRTTLTLGTAGGVWPVGAATSLTSTNSGQLTIKANGLLVNGGVNPFGVHNGHLQN
ncbi:MAG: hypothetical protein EOP35_10245, partial [Rubrivivax sp.]